MKTGTLKGNLGSLVTETRFIEGGRAKQGLSINLIDIKIASGTKPGQNRELSAGKD